ncbi:hypothetical protein GCM10010191_84350 [Actinomadura vinacea]|uniref:Secreted protein n=1 Tax=Actinomadura vinacea TaxID=115336 RepID=A0ABN3KC60_9ACTN
MICLSEVVMLVSFTAPVKRHTQGIQGDAGKINPAGDRWAWPDKARVGSCHPRRRRRRAGGPPAGPGPVGTPVGTRRVRLCLFLKDGLGAVSCAKRRR